MRFTKKVLYAIRGGAVCLAVICLFSPATRAQMKMHIINVGQAESILLEFPRHAILIDAGSEESNDNRYETHLFRYLNKFFTDRPDLNNTLHSVVVSHPHKDHTRNLVKVFNEFKVENFIEGGGRNDASGIDDVRLVRNLLGQENAKHHRIYARDVKRPSFMREWREEILTGSGAEIRFLSAGRRCNDDNNASLVMRVDYKGKSFLLTGDSEVDDTERRNVGCGGLVFRLLDMQAAFPELLDVDVYKAAHHGSHNGTVDVLLRKITPDYSVISAGGLEVRSPDFYHAWHFGHPKEVAVKIMEDWTTKFRPTPITVTTMIKKYKPNPNRRIEKAVYCTAWDGDIVFFVGQNGEMTNPSINTN